MYKLWRRELSNPIVIESSSKKKQSSFTEILSQIVKIIKKKQELYIHILFSNATRPHSSDHYPASPTLKNIHYQNQIENVLAEEEKIVGSFKQYQGEPFFISKTYLYTLYVRLIEIFEYSRQKITIKAKDEDKPINFIWQKYYDDNKLALNDCYQNLIYFQNYNLIELINLAIRKQNHRIYSLVPPKIKKTQLTLKPLIRLSSTEIKSRTSASNLESSQKKQEISEILAKKLSKKQRKLQTQKRIEEREIKKIKRAPQMTFKGLYGIMNVKQVKVEEGYAFMKGLEIQLMERNAMIIDNRKQYSKEYEERKQKKYTRTKKQ